MFFNNFFGLYFMFLMTCTDMFFKDLFKPFCSDPSWGGLYFQLGFFFREFWPIDIFIVES